MISSITFSLIFALIISNSLQQNPIFNMGANTCTTSTNISNCSSGSNLQIGIICCTIPGIGCSASSSIGSFSAMTIFQSNFPDNSYSLNCWDHNPTQAMYSTANQCLNVSIPNTEFSCNLFSTNDIACCMSTTIMNNGSINSVCSPIYANLTRYFLNNNFISNDIKSINLNCGSLGSYFLPTSNGNVTIHAFNLLLLILSFIILL